MVPSSRVISGEGGIRLSVTEWGDASNGRPTVLLVHGYPDTSAVWQPVASLLASHYHVVAYDVRGAGASSAPGSTGGYRLSHLIEDLAAVVDATSLDRPVHLVGHDWGSIQGWEAVSTDRLQGRIASFTSLYAPGLDHAAAWAAIRWRHPTPHHLSQLLGQQLRWWYVAAFHLPGAAALWRAGLGRGWPRILQWVEHVGRSDSYPAPTVAEDGARGIALYRANFGPRMTRAHPRPTTVPVQVIVPLEDHFVSPALSEGLEQWVDRLWRTEVVGGHWLPRTDPELVARYVAQLVDHIEGGPEAPRLRQARIQRS
ncbi:MAG: alpha/beta fold hydrolase [Actinomycetota bacterium]|nr:alpha/beta fold hydrolase [Actinomycetota bacterium]